MADDAVLHKRLLGRELSELRKAAEVSLAEAAERLGRTHNSIRRFEAGQTMIDELQLRTLCEHYDAPQDIRDRLMGLRELARQPVWWASLGPRPPSTAAMLSMEDSARRIREYDHNAIPGLLQTPAYARANIDAIDSVVGKARIAEDVELRMERQAKIWGSSRPPEAHFLVDEAALYRMPGGGEAKRAQLARLVTAPPTATVQIIPFDAGPHPSLGTYLIFDLELGSPAITKSVYVEGSAAQQGVIVEGDAEIAQYELAFERTRSKALPAKESAKYIQQRIRGIADD